MVDSLTQSLINLLAPQASDPDLMRAFVAVIEDWYGATEADRLRGVSTLFTTVKLFENAWFQQRHGTLDLSNGKPGIFIFGSTTIGRACKPGGRCAGRCLRLVFASMSNQLSRSVI
jgi:hypothetical protein